MKFHIRVSDNCSELEDWMSTARRLFRGQAGEFFDEKKLQGYQEAYGMLFLSDDINNAHFYTKPGQYQKREILVFEVPDKIAQVKGVYIDRLGSDEIAKLKQQGYVGVTSDIGELIFDKGEVGMFQNYAPVKRFQTEDGKFSQEDVAQLKSLGLSDTNVRKEQ